MTITVRIKPDVQAELAVQAASRGMDVPTYAAALLEQAAQPALAEAQAQSAPPAPRLPGRKNLVELFAESPLKGLDLDFSRNRSTGRPVGR